MELAIPTITILDIIKGMEYVIFRKSLKFSNKVYFKIEIPNWIIENGEINLADIMIKEFRRQIDHYRLQFPQRRRDREVRMYCKNMRINIDSKSMYCYDRNLTVVTLVIDAYFSNTFMQNNDNSDNVFSN